MTRTNRVAVAIAALAAGLIVAPAAWATGNQGQASVSQRHVRQPQVQRIQSTRVPLNSCDYDRAAGRCVIDLGYGRCMECNAGPLN
jgi:hypothetical protein